MSRRHQKSATLAHPDPATPTAPTETTVVPADKDQNNNALSQEDIRLHAYQKWEGAGKPDGDGLRFWLEAEQELRQGK